MERTWTGDIIEQDVEENISDFGGSCKGGYSFYIMRNVTTVRRLQILLK
jgi:hypothetical protein